MQPPCAAISPISHIVRLILCFSRLPLSPCCCGYNPYAFNRSYRPAARQAAAARWISPHCCSGRKIDLPKYDTGLQGHRIPVNSAVVPCSRYSQGKRGEIYNSSLTFLRLSPYSFLAAFIAAPKALKSYNGTGLFAIFIHPVTFYSSPFFLDMSHTIHIIRLNTSCCVLTVD